MKGKSNLPGGIINKNEFNNHMTGSLEESIRERSLDTYSSGVLSGSQMEGESVPFEITDAGGLYIDVGTGVAISPSELDYDGEITAQDQNQLIFGGEMPSGGERIIVPPAHVVASSANYWSRTQADAGTGLGTGPFHETDNSGDTGSTGFAYTPQSTMPLRVPLVDDTTNYIWIAYLPTVDESQFSVHPYSGSRIFPIRNDGYDILVTQTDVQPDSAYNRYIKLGSVLTSSGVVDTIDQSAMPYAAIRPNRVGITVSDTPTTEYDTTTTPIFLDNHISALGNGATISPSNPHRQKIQDLDGVDEIEEYTQNFQRDSHSNGIVGSISGNTAKIMGVDNAPPVETAKDMVVRVKQLTSSEAVYIAGIKYDEIQNVYTYSGTSYAFAGLDVGDTDGIYIVYLYAATSGAAVGMCYEPLSGSLLPDDHIKLGTVTKSASTLAVDAYDTEEYYEPFFGLTSNVNIQNRAVGSYNIKLADGTSGQTTTTGDGIKTAHIQDGAITNAKVSATAAIAYSKLNLTSSIQLTDLAVGITGAVLDDPEGTTTLYGLTAGDTEYATQIGSVPKWLKFGVTYSELEDSATTKSIVIFTLPLAGVIHGAKIKHSTSFGGGSISAFTLSLGISGDTEGISSQFNVFTDSAPAGDNFQISNVLYAATDSATKEILLTAESTGADTDDLTQGEAEVWLLVSIAK